MARRATPTIVVMCADCVRGLLAKLRCGGVNVQKKKQEAECDSIHGRGLRSTCESLIGIGTPGSGNDFEPERRLGSRRPVDDRAQQRSDHSRRSNRVSGLEETTYTSIGRICLCLEFDGRRKEIPTLDLLSATVPLPQV